MNFFAISTILILCGAVAFFGAGSSFIALNMSALLAVVSIMAAAILVRLNRGVPSVDWKAVEAPYLENLLDGIERITKAYVITFVIAIICILTIFGSAMLSASNLSYRNFAGTIISVFFGATFGLLIGRMIYIIWLDLDIVRLQRKVIVSAADGIDSAAQKAIAEKKLEDMKRVSITLL